MKKRILSCIAIVAILCALILFAFWKNQTEQETSPVSTSGATYDALIQVNPEEKAKKESYDLIRMNKTNSTDSYLPVGDVNNDLLFYQKNLTVHINRSLALSQKDLCHYGLFEKNGTPFAVFYAEITTQDNAERLSHLMLCYRDYFPILLFGEFDDNTDTLLSDVCQLSTASVNSITYYYQNLTPTSRQSDGALMLAFQNPPRTLDLRKKMVALTYDDGPSSYTESILTTLAKHNAKATFFVNGTHVSQHPTVIQNIFSNHSEIGNHTNLHELFEQNTQGIIRKSIEETNDRVRELIGIGTFVVRPPGGGTLDRYNKQVSVGYPIVRWSLDTFDYTEGQSPSSVFESIQSKIRDGDIVLMHDTKAITAEAADSIISYLTSQGFQLVTVSELLEFSTDGAVIDRVYNNTYLP